MPPSSQKEEPAQLQVPTVTVVPPPVAHSSQSAPSVPKIEVVQLDKNGLRKSPPVSSSSSSAVPPSESKSTSSSSSFCIIDTKRLKPVSFNLPQPAGSTSSMRFSIGDGGALKLEKIDGSKLTSLEVETCGINCHYEERNGSTGDHRQRKYNYRKLPRKLRAWYGYASQIVQHMRSQTAKIVIQYPDYKCELMENGPHANCKVSFYGADPDNAVESCLIHTVTTATVGEAEEQAGAQPQRMATCRTTTNCEFALPLEMVFL